MIIKIFGSIIVFLASTVLGYVFSRDCASRPGELRDLQGQLAVFENEINYFSNLLRDSFTKVASIKSTTSIFFLETVKLINEMDMDTATAWSNAVTQNISKTSLNNEDKDILLAFGELLGNSDLDGQIKNIHLTTSRLKIQEAKAEENRKKNEKMYKSLGILGGLALVIILI